MARLGRIDWRLALAGVLLALTGYGCACFRCLDSLGACCPHIDPTGNHIFLHGNPDPAPALTTAPPYAPAGPPPLAPVVSPPVPPPPAATAPVAAAPAVIAPVLPTDANGVVLVPQSGVSISPTQVVAPVNTEVLMISTVMDPRGYGVARERMEWMISPGGVGQFISPGSRTGLDALRGLPKKVNNTYVINSTLGSSAVLNRGTPSPADDVTVREGQSWVTIGSPVEGTTFVTAFAPDVKGWDHRQQTGTIYWLDAQWIFPSPAIDPAGSRRPLVTTVTRQTDGTPLVGWTVRYEVTGGPPAGFAPQGSNILEVVTDSTGKATAEIFETAPAPGTNQVSIQVIRPADAAGAGGRALTVGSGTVLQTWTGADGAIPPATVPLTAAPGATVPPSALPPAIGAPPATPPASALRATGPSQAGVGATVTYRITVTNPLTTPASDVVVNDDAPAGLVYLNSNPAADSTPAGQTWRFPNLAPGQSTVIETNYRVVEPGTLNYCASISGGGLTGRDCVSTVAAAGQLNVSILGPQTAEVGSQVTYTIDIANQSDATLTHVVVSDRFDPGLHHSVATAGAIERDLQEDIPPRQSRQLAVTFQVVQSGQACQDVTITAEGGLRGEAHTCLTVPDRQAPAVMPPATPPASPPANPPANEPADEPPATQPAPPAAPQGVGKLSVQVGGPDSRKLDELAPFTITVTNTGNAPLTNLVVANNFETSLEADSATPTPQWRGGALVWTLDSLAPGATKTWTLQCRCVKEAAKACNRVTVTADGGVQEGDEACLQISANPTTPAAPPAASTPAPGNLTVSIAEQTDPIRVDGETIYQIVVTNAGSVPLQQVVASVRISQELQLDKIVASPVAGTSFPRQVRFKPISEIRAGETITFELQIRALTAGTGTVEVEVAAPGLAQAVTANASTQIVD